MKWERISQINCLRGFLLSLFHFTVFAVVGRALCDTLAHERSMTEQCVTIIWTCIAAIIVFLLIYILNRDSRLAHILSKIFGMLLLLFMVCFSFELLSGVMNHKDSYKVDWWRYYIDRQVKEQIPEAPWHYEYDAALLVEVEDIPDEGWWRADVDILAEERRIWSLTKPVGEGESYYEYDESVLRVPAKTEEEAKREPYRSALEERERLRYVLYQDDNTMLNILSYRFGRWVLSLYILAAAAWTLSCIRLFVKDGGGWNKVFFISAWFVLMLRIWLPVLNCVGLVFACYGAPFTGRNPEIDVYGVGIPIGVIAAYGYLGNRIQNPAGIGKTT